MKKLTIYFIYTIAALAILFGIGNLVSTDAFNGIIYGIAGWKISEVAMQLADRYGGL